MEEAEGREIGQGKITVLVDRITVAAISFQLRSTESRTLVYYSKD